MDSVLAGFLAGGTAACIAEAASLPLDTAKVRMQLQRNAPGQAAKYRSLPHCVLTIAREEGMSALWSGLSPGLQRQMVFATLRIGLYAPVRDLFSSMGPEGSSSSPPLYIKLLAGLTTGTIGITMANPTDLVKIRLQGEGYLPPGTPRRYNGALDAYRKIIAQEGLSSLWRTGLVPNIARNSVISSAELVTYDEFKTRMLAANLMNDHIGLHMLAGLAAGFVATCVGSPLDVTKSRIMNQKVAADGTREYKNALDCVLQIARKEGPRGFYKGFWPNFGRIASWNIVMFLSFEQIKKLLTP